MEIVKQNETYQITDSNPDKGWEMSGTANRDLNSSLIISFSVSKPGELIENIGDCTYSKPIDNEGRVSVSYTVSEVNRDEFMVYMDSVIDSVLEHFEPQK